MYSRFNFANITIENTSKFAGAKFLESYRVFCFISTGTLGSFGNSFPAVTSLSQPCFRHWRFILLVQTKEMISINYGSSTSIWKTLYDAMNDNKLIPSMDPLTNWAAATVEESILKISSYRASLNWLQRPSQSTPEYRKLCDEKEHTPLILTKSQ